MLDVDTMSALYCDRTVNEIINSMETDSQHSLNVRNSCRPGVVSLAQPWYGKIVIFFGKH